MVEKRDADTFTEAPDTAVWLFDHCPCDVDEEGVLVDPDVSCEGCAGWGLECGAVYVRRDGTTHAKTGEP